MKLPDKLHSLLKISGALLGIFSVLLGACQTSPLLALVLGVGGFLLLIKNQEGLQILEDLDLKNWW